MSTLISNTTFTDGQHAAYAAEAAALATSSVSYWYDNFDEWQEEFCDDQPQHMQQTALNSPEDPCEDYNGGSIRLMQLHDNDPMDFAIKVGKEDIKGYIEMGAAVYNGYKSIKDNWAQVGRSFPTGAVMVRYMMPSTATMVVQGAKTIGRFSVVGLIGSTLLDSAIGMAH